jgi:hypothetical protein
MRDMGTLCSMGVTAVSERQLDDTLAYLARYLRQPIEWLEDQPLTRVSAWAEATNRLVAMENGKHEPLDISSQGEETR